MATSERSIKCGDVIVVPFPYSDQMAEKRRPALVVSSDKFNARGTFLWVVMITSKAQKPHPDDIVLDHASAGLSKPSVARVAKIATIEYERVVRVAGKIDGKTRKKVRANLAGILD